MEVAEHLDALRWNGELLAAAAARSGPDTQVPTCPGWSIGDLVRHVGGVHRWAAAHVAERRTQPVRDVREVAGPLPGDTDLLDWYEEGLSGLVATLETADPDTMCWTFLPAPTPVRFWARRQAHETGIHRADAESPEGPITPFGPEFAVDGIEELLFGFLGRRDEDLRTDPPLALHLAATDCGSQWLVRLGEGVSAVREAGEADCAVCAPASDLYLLVWNRRSPEGLDVAGDPSLLAFWKENVHVRWSRER